MGEASDRSRALRASISANRGRLIEVLREYRASNPRLFGSVARGDAGFSSDVDVLVDLEPDAGNPLLRVAGIGEEFTRILGVPVDVVTESLLRESVSEGVRRDSVAL